MQQTSNLQEPPLKKEIQELKNKREFLASNGAVTSIDLENPDETSSAIDKLQEKINSLETKLEAETVNIEHLFQAKEKISDVKLETYRTLMKVAILKETSPLSLKDKARLNAFLLMSHFLAPALEQFVRKQSKKLGVKAIIDDTIIESAFQKQKEMEEKKNQSVKQALQEKKEAQKLLE